MKKSIAAITALCTIAGTAHAADGGARVFKPAGQWTADYGDDYCRLSRNFSDGGDTLTLAFERIQPGPALRMILVGSDLKNYRNTTAIGWHFTPDDPERTAFPYRSETADGKQWYNFGLLMLDPKASTGFIDHVELRQDFTNRHPTSTPKGVSDPAPGPPPPAYDRDAEQTMAKDMTGVIVDAGLTTPIEIQTGGLGPPVSALQACADDLAKTWGVDPAKDKTRSAAAWPQDGPVGWLPTGAIPFQDVPKLVNGANQVRLLVDATGKPTSCHINWPSLDKGVNDRICATLMDKAKFTPAKDAGGQPTAGYWIGDPLLMLTPMKGFKPR